MIIGIHARKNSYSDRWIQYCKEHSIDFKVVNAYDDDIIDQLKDCDAFMWHHSHGNYRDVNFAKQLLFSLEQSGKKVFPNFNTGWHFDDKLGQKYLFEAHGVNSAKAWAFYDKESAYDWVGHTSFPKVFKLRGGAGSSNVFLVKNKRAAKKFIRKMFGRGMKMDPLRMAWEKLVGAFKGRNRFYDFAKYIGLFLFPRKYGSGFMPIQKGYAYFQEFIPNDGFDYRVQICGDKAVTMIRKSREGDFRASGSNNSNRSPKDFPSDVLFNAFHIANTLNVQALALDFVRSNHDQKLYLVEVSYCYGVDDDEFDYGYWTADGVWHDEAFNGIDWMIEEVINNC